MGTLKKFRNYILIIIGIYLLTSIFIFIGFNANYKPITLLGNVPGQMSIAKAEASKSDVRIYGYVKNSEDNDINGKYIITTIYDSENEEITKKAIKIEGVENNTEKMFKVLFNEKNVKYYKIEISENDK